MIGIFDSGVGGICAYKEVRRRLKRENIVYLADRDNAPYGTKTQEELIALTSRDIERLKELGARKILIACCTASSVHSFLDSELREISLPIIQSSALAASTFSRVAVIATEHTVSSHAFKRAIEDRFGVICLEFAHQELVSLVESGEKGALLRKSLLKIKDEVQGSEADALILGCTHFSHLEDELRELLPTTHIISPAREGANALLESLEYELPEGGRIIYT